MHTVIKTIIQLASSLNINDVAEEIETEEQSKQLCYIVEHGY